MSAPGRPQREYRSAQHEGTLMRALTSLLSIIALLPNDSNVLVVPRPRFLSGTAQQNTARVARECGPEGMQRGHAA